MASPLELAREFTAKALAFATLNKTHNKYVVGKAQLLETGRIKEGFTDFSDFVALYSIQTDGSPINGLTGETPGVTMIHTAEESLTNTRSVQERAREICEKILRLSLPQSVKDLPIDVTAEQNLLRQITPLGLPHAVLLFGTTVQTNEESVVFYWLVGADPVKQFNVFQQEAHVRLRQMNAGQN